MPKTIKKELNTNDNLKKILHYCAYQERCWAEVRNKMNEMNLSTSEKDTFLYYLNENNYVNEHRYSSAIVRGKFNQKKWGRLKIQFELRAKQIPETIIKQAFEEDITTQAYEQTIEQLYHQKINECPHATAIVRKDKAIKYILSKGFEYPIIESVIKNIGNPQLRLY